MATPVLRRSRSFAPSDVFAVIGSALLAGGILLGGLLVVGKVVSLATGLLGGLG